MKPTIDSFYKGFGEKIDLLHQIAGGSVVPQLAIDNGPDEMIVRVTVPGIPAIMFFADTEPNWLHIGVRRQREGQCIDQCVISMELIGQLKAVNYRDGWIEVTVNH